MADVAREARPRRRREKDSMTILAETTAGVAVEEALVETEQSLEAALVRQTRRTR